MKRVFFLATTALLLFSASAEATFWLFRRPVEVRTYYHWPSPVWVSYSSPMVYPIMVSAPVAPIYSVPVQMVPLATPVAAPPSVTPEPPLLPAQPPTLPPTGQTTARKINTSFYSLYSGATQKGILPAPGRCSVAFWNLAGQPITLRIAGVNHVLAAGRSLTLDLPRLFAWQVVGREAEATRIDADHTTAEILIRR